VFSAQVSPNLEVLT